MRKPGALLAGVTCATVLAAHVPGAQVERPRFSSGVSVVEVYASVTDTDGTPVVGLDSRDFEVFEDGRRQTVSVFSADDVPLTVALGVDRSFSMAGMPLQLASRAAVSFLRGLRPSDRSLVVSIGTEADILAPLAFGRDAQVRAVETLDAWGTTALLDATVTALDRLAAEPGRQALVVFSDGVDRYSRATAADVLNRSRRGSALVYPITIGRSRPPLMVELAAATGGRSFLVTDVRGLTPALASIVAELRSQYLLGFVPDRRPGPGAAGWRSIRVELVGARSPGARVRARDGYVAR
jgi:Ca-activated chloride channel family protein